MKRAEHYAHLFPGDVQDVIGFEVVGGEGASLGRVQAVMLDDTQQKIRFLEVARPEPRFIPVEGIAAVDAGQVTLNLTAAHVASAPIVSPDADLPAWAELYRYYGLVPHWDAENIFPGYPGS